MKRRQGLVAFLTVLMAGPIVQQLLAQPAQSPVSFNLRTTAARQATVQALKERATKAKTAAEAVARQKGWPVRGKTAKGQTFELIEVVDGRPHYYVTHNANAALSSGASLIRNTPPYNLSGAGYSVGVWDGGAVRATHRTLSWFIAPLCGSRRTQRNAALKVAGFHSTFPGWF